MAREPRRGVSLISQFLASSGPHALGGIQPQWQLLVARPVTTALSGDVSCSAGLQNALCGQRVTCAIFGTENNERVLIASLHAHDLLAS